MVSEGIARGFVRPLSRVTYGAHEASKAMRFIATSRQFGRVLLRINDEALPATKRFVFQYVLCFGGLTWLFV